MADKEMWDYLSTSVSANSTEILDIKPNNIITESASIKTIINTGDDGSEERISLGSTLGPIFKVSLTWKGLESTDAGTIFDFFNSTAIGNGMARSFNWNHPQDGHRYVVRFDDDIQRSVDITSGFNISARFRVLGRAASTSTSTST